MCRKGANPPHTTRWLWMSVKVFHTLSLRSWYGESWTKDFTCLSIAEHIVDILGTLKWQEWKNGTGKWGTKMHYGKMQNWKKKRQVLNDPIWNRNDEGRSSLLCCKFHDTCCWIVTRKAVWSKESNDTPVCSRFICYCLI